jgi:ABC-type amino acid transport substrate-binding protein
MQLARSGSHRGRRVAMAGIRIGPLALMFLLLAGAVPASAQTLDRIRDTGTLRLGYRTDARPFSYEESGKPAGYSVALCQKIADAVKAKLQLPDLRVEYTPLSVDDSLPAVQQGKIDLLCGATTVTLSRRELVDFSIPIYPSGIAALVRYDAPARLQELLSGKPQPKEPRWRASLGLILQKRVFAVHAGTTAETWVKEKLHEFDIVSEVRPVEDYAAGVEDVVERRADVLFADRVILEQAAAQSAAAEDLIVLPQQFTLEWIALALERDDADFRLLVDRTLSGLYRSDEIADIYKSSFGETDERTLQFFRVAAPPE